MDTLLRLSIFILLGSACATTKHEFQVSTDTIKPREKMKWLGKDVHLTGDSSIAVGRKFPAVKLKDYNLKDVVLDLKGQISIVSVLPSLDTPVCDIQTHELSESSVLHQGIERITISMDLPYAQNRFKEKSGLHNVKYYSDYAYKQFAHQSGLLIREKSVLARALIVVGRDGYIRYLQIVPEILKKPNMEEAFLTANRLWGLLGEQE